MKIAISYFYHIRFFKPYMLPISTAVWDPKWYHHFQGDDKVFLDKNHVVNGLRVPILSPGATCEGLCRGVDNCISKNPNECAFLIEYEKQLNLIDFDLMMKELEQSAMKLKSMLKFEEEPLMVLMVYEKPDNQCSERTILMKWFREHGVELQELRYPIASNY